MPAENGEQHDTPENGEGIVVASVAACLLQAVQEFPVGKGFEKLAKGLKRGTIFELPPGEKRVRRVDVHGGPRVRET